MLAFLLLSNISVLLNSIDHQLSKIHLSANMESNSPNLLFFLSISSEFPQRDRKSLISLMRLSYSHFIPYASKSIFTVNSGSVLIIIFPSGIQMFLCFSQFKYLFSEIWLAKLFLLTRLLSKFIFSNKSSLACLNNVIFHLVFSNASLLFATNL